MQFERRADVSVTLLVVAPLAAIAVALLLCAGLIAAAGVSPITA
jgi:simple sugar transport system permease protein